jgi:hypothetical protein
LSASADSPEKLGKTRQILSYQPLSDKKPLAAHYLRSGDGVETGGREVQARTVLGAAA